MKYNILSQREESIAEKIVDSAFTVHKVLGPGLLERVYEVCFCHELSKRELKYQRQVDLPITYDGMIFDEGLRFPSNAASMTFSYSGTSSGTGNSGSPNDFWLSP